jgi:hypothetical protein
MTLGRTPRVTLKKGVAHPVCNTQLNILLKKNSYPLLKWIPKIKEGKIFYIRISNFWHQQSMDSKIQARFHLLQDFKLIDDFGYYHEYIVPSVKVIFLTI